MDKDKHPGFMIDNFFITFPPEGDIVQEHEDGSMSILLDIYKVTADGERSPIEQDEITPELEEKINAYVNKMLEDAIAEYKEKING